MISTHGPKPTTFTHYGRLFDGFVFQHATRDSINAWLTQNPEYGVIKESSMFDYERDEVKRTVYVARNDDKGRGS